MNGLQRTGLLLFWLLTPGILFSQSITREQVFVDPAFTYDRWTVEEGLPVNSINQMLQSIEGYIWFGTYDGLVRFDGIRFKVYKSAEYAGLPGNRIINLEETPDGILWLRTEQEKLVRFNDDSFRELTAEDGLTSSQVHTIYKDGEGRLWIGTNRGISVYEKGILKPYYPENITESVIVVYVDDNNVVWYKADNPIRSYRFDGQQKKPITSAPHHQYPTPSLTLHDGSTLFTTPGHLYKYNSDTLVDQWINLPDNFQIIDLVETRNGTVLAATLNHGIVKLTGRSPETINPGYRGRIIPGFGGRMGESLLPDGENMWAVGDKTVLFNNKKVFSFNDQVTDFVYDREGSFWFGTSGSGLFRIKPNMFKIYSDEQTSTGKAVYPVIEAEDGSIWFGYGAKVARLTNGKLYTDFRYPSELKAPTVRTLLQRKNGDLLAHLGMGGIAILGEDGRTFIPYRIPIVPDENELIAHALYEDKLQRLWIGTSQGVFVKTDSEWKKIPLQLLPSQYVRYFSEAPDGSIWMGTYGAGIYHYRFGKFQNYSKQDGLAGNLVRSIYIDTTSENDDYWLWIGTEDKGLNRLPVQNGTPDFSRITHYDEQSGLYDNVVHQILVDKYDRFWMSGNKGISWIRREELEQYASGTISAVHATAYTERDGLRNREANGGVQSAGMISSDGNLWFPTQDGLVMVNPDDITRNELPPPVIIEEIISDETPIRINGAEVVLKPGQRDFEITYTGLSFMVPEKVRFRYRLQGFNDHWVEAGTRRTAFYTNVPSGTYTFEVLAANNEGIWSPQPAALSVRVLPFFYETKLFYLFLFVLLSGVVVMAVRLRTRHLKNRERELERSVHERTAELEEEKKKTEAQAQELLKLDRAKSQFFTNITHEFRTPLTLIIGPLKKLLKRNKDTPAEEIDVEIERTLRSSFRLQRLIDQILDVSKLEAGELKPEVHQIDLGQFISKLLELFRPLAREQEQNLEFICPPGEHLVFADSDALEKITANLVSNAIKFTPPEGTIKVELEEIEKEFVIKVQDSGIGIPPEKVPHIFDRFYQADDSSTRVAEGSGVGLALVKQLVELHKGRISVQSEPGRGTSFLVSLKKGTSHFPETVIHPAQSGSDPVQFEPQKYSDYASSGDSQDTHDKRKNVPTVLVVEDNTDMRDFVSSVLVESFSVIQAGDGEAALKLIKQHLPDLIIADIMMPKMDGMQLNNELKKDPMLESVPVIFLTAKMAHDSKLKGFEEGADDYLVKPFDPELLVARVNNIIQKRKKLREFYLGRKAPFSPADNTDPFVNEVTQILEEHFADPEFGISELTSLVHLDRTRLFRKMKELTSKSPQQYLIDFRMKKAVHMIESKEGTISEIAYASGFNSLAHFSKTFKKHFKVAPSDYLER